MSKRNIAKKGRPLGRAARWLRRNTGARTMSQTDAVAFMVGHFLACKNMRVIDASAAWHNMRKK
jgi:hypothetical protein